MSPSAASANTNVQGCGAQPPLLCAELASSTTALRLLLLLLRGRLPPPAIPAASAPPPLAPCAGTHPAFNLKNADLTCASLQELSVYNIRWVLCDAILCLGRNQGLAPKAHAVGGCAPVLRRVLCHTAALPQHGAAH